jgi:hypothetical protein
VVAGAWRFVGRVVVEEFELLAWQQLVVVLAWWVELWWLSHFALWRRENHISGNILTSGEEAHGNAGTALRRNYCRIAGLEAFVSDKQSKGLFSAAQ